MPKRLWTGAATVLAMAFLAALLHGWESLQDPLFSGDPSYRVFFADRPIVKLGNHIWLYRLLHLPVAGLKLISVAYLLLALSRLGLYWRRILGPGPLSLALAVLAVVSSAAQPLTGPSAISCRNPPAMASSSCSPTSSLGNKLSAPHPAPPPPTPLLRHPLGHPRPLARGRRPCHLLGGLPSPPVPLPPRYPSQPQHSPPLEPRRLPRRWRHPGRFPPPPPTLRLSPLVLLLVYGILLAVDPWPETPGNIRMAAPLLELSFLLAPLVLQSATAAPKPLRHIATAAIAAGLVVSALPSLTPRQHPGREDIHAAHARLKAALDAAGQGKPASACLMAPDRWPVFRELSAPAFYHRETYLTPNDAFPAHCQVLVVDQSLTVVPPPHFRQIDSLSTGDSRWRVYLTFDLLATPSAPTPR